jgi:hypothetical protein
MTSWSGFGSTTGTALASLIRSLRVWALNPPDEGRYRGARTTTSGLVGYLELGPRPCLCRPAGCGVCVRESQLTHKTSRALVQLASLTLGSFEPTGVGRTRAGGSRDELNQNAVERLRGQYRPCALGLRWPLLLD